MPRSDDPTATAATEHDHRWGRAQGGVRYCLRADCSASEPDRDDTLAECADCGAVIQGDVTGQNRHDIWHRDLDQKIELAARWRPAPRIGGR